MPTVTYIQENGTRYDIHVESGHSVMQGAVDNMIEGIQADCGGCCSCATCHCYVDEVWQDKMPPLGEVEKDLLEFVIEPQANSRLSCQLIVSEELDGLVVRLPAAQF